MASKLLTGDEVLVIRGRDRGARGRIRQNMPREGKVVVDGVNIVRRHLPRQSNVRQGGIVEREAPLDRSKVMLICPSCDQPTRVGFRFLDDGSKVRYCHKCDAVIPRPEVA
ncbi:MAG TPA: 50S ribosomal protein L24 [Thermomicrobiales bacterium]|nr:50S ribosomal protein L24 [Thermomicrobiales bacterium]